MSQLPDLPPKKCSKPRLFISTGKPETERGKLDAKWAGVTSANSDEEPEEPISPPSGVTFVPLSPGTMNSPRKKSATMGNFLETRETSWKFQQGGGSDSTSSAEGPSEVSRCQRENDKDQSSSDSEASDDLPPPPIEILEDSSDSGENIYEDVQPPPNPHLLQKHSAAVRSLFRPPKSKKFALTLEELCARRAKASSK